MGGGGDQERRLSMRVFRSAFKPCMAEKGANRYFSDR
jgi:hypothetical protein